MPEFLLVIATEPELALTVESSEHLYSEGI